MMSSSSMIILAIFRKWIDNNIMITLDKFIRLKMIIRYIDLLYSIIFQQDFSNLLVFAFVVHDNSSRAFIFVNNFFEQELGDWLGIRRLQRSFFTPSTQIIPREYSKLIFFRRYWKFYNIYIDLVSHNLSSCRMQWFFLFNSCSFLIFIAGFYEIGDIFIYLFLLIFSIHVLKYSILFMISNIVIKLLEYLLTLLWSLNNSLRRLLVMFCIFEKMIISDKKCMR